LRFQSRPRSCSRPEPRALARLRVLAPLGALALAAFLAGCAGRPDGFLLPVEAPAEGASRVDVLVATTRASLGAAPGEMFSGERAYGLAFADVAVSIPPDAARTPGDVQWPASAKADPAHEFAALGVRRLEGGQAAGVFHERLRRTRHRSVLLFVHGYNTRFDEAVFRLAQIAHDAKAPAVPVLFTWPSRGRLLAYAYDRESANFSRDALESVLRSFADDPATAEITILAHSMGNWVTLEALRQMSIRNGRISPKIRSVMLAAPDVDIDVFRRQIEAIGEKRPPFMLFVSQDDKALALSRRLWGSTARLGAIDPEQEPLRSQLQSARVQVIDLTNQSSSDSLNHGKFAGSPDVARLIGGKLASGQTLSSSHVGLGESLGLVATGAAGAMGRAASIAVTAPAAIVDRRAREGLADQVEDLRGHVQDTVSHAVTPPGRR
jgi:esterase/lipase superfamily enzyme